MKIVKNKLIPFKGFIAITFFGTIWTRKEKLNDVTINHEAIHIKQEKELLYLFFYLIYLFEWLFKSIYYLNFYRGYKEVSFEKEAYSNEKNLDYLKTRKKFSQWRKK